MGVVTNLIVFFLILSVLIISLSGCQPMPTDSNKTFCYGVNATSALSSFVSSNGSASLTDKFLSTIQIGLGLTAGATVVLSAVTGTFTFPNPYVIFFAFTTSLIYSWVGVPYDLFKTLPDPVGLVLFIGFSFIILMGIVVWYKGTGEL